MDTASQKPSPEWGIGKRILWISLSLLCAQIIGSIFNIWYNLTHIRPLLTAAQIERFMGAIRWYNALIYPLALAVWLGITLSIARVWKTGERKGDAWCRATRRMINLPWIAIMASGAPWLLSIPVFLAAVRSTPDPLDPQVNLHLPVSIVIGALISTAQGFFAVEILTQRLLYPLFLTNTRSESECGAYRITLGRRGLIWTVSSVACPIVSLLLLFVTAARGGGGMRDLWFPFSVGTVGILFGFVSVWLLARIVIEPVEALRYSAARVGEGDLETRIDLLRTDEFGLLIGQFNEMVSGLREKQRVEEILGRNVGLEVARILLEQGDVEKGAERSISVLFTDIRGFTERCSASAADEVVAMLNIFFDVMVPEVEARRGIVNQFAGDGFMAIFGAIEAGCIGHEDAAAAAGCAMIAALPRVNAVLAERGIEPLEIGVGINSGPAVIGSVGATGRTSFTAIGDTVNVAARIESLTKKAGYPLLLSATTFEALSQKPETECLPPMRVKGKANPVQVYGIKCRDCLS